MTTPAQPLLEGWQTLTETERKELFEESSQRAAVEVFAQNADQYQDAAGNFRFPIAGDMTLTLSAAAVQAALRYHPQTAQSLAKLVTVAVGSKQHQMCVTTIINLVHHLSPKVK